MTALLLLAASSSGRGESAERPRIDWRAHNATVVFFILHDCPICNSYVREMNRIAADYRDRGFGFVAAYVDVDFSRDEAQQHARDYGFDFPFVLDSYRKLAAATGTKVAPEAAVFNSKGEMLYRGRIDDLYADIDKRRSAVRERSLRDALDDIAAGVKPKRAVVPGVGCPIEPRRS